MKLSFALPSKSKPSSKSNPIKPSKTFESSSAPDNGAASKHYLKEFDASKPLPSGPAAPIIPPIENEWRPHMKMKNLDLPITDPASRGLNFEPETLSIEPDSNISYGLNVRKASGDTETPAGESAGDRLRAGAGAVEETLLEKLKSDLERLSDHKGMEEYEGMPVEGFGAALLSGYGWYPGRGIGRNAKGDVKVKEYTKSTDRHGLGFHKNSANSKKKREREEEEEEEEKEVRIVKGRENVGRRASVVDRLANGKVVLRLVKRVREDEEVEVRVSMEDFVEVGSREEEKWWRSKEEEAAKRDSEKRRRSHSTWLARHIRVRVISKEFKGGRFYLKKGEVLDVVGPSTCDVSMDESREVIQGVSEDFLETALPRRGGPVLVLTGKHKGVFGSLVEKDSDRETGVVKDADTQGLLNVKLEQIAEFTGDPSDLGY